MLRIKVMISYEFKKHFKSYALSDLNSFIFKKTIKSLRYKA